MVNFKLKKLKQYTVKYLVNYFWKYVIKSILERSSLYITFARYKYFGKRYQTKIARKYFDLIIEGFPRSANSYSTRLIQHLEPRFLIGNHLHSFTHINYGIKNSIPTIVLIRNPHDAIISLTALDIINNYNDSKREFLEENSLRWMIKSYIKFYEPLKKSLNKVVVLKFEEITTNPVNAIKKINNRFSLNLDTDTKIITYYSNKIFERAKNHLKPSSNRNEIKNELIKEINTDVDLIKLFDLANNLYLDIIDKIYIKP
jgi:hypothetical protein